LALHLERLSTSGSRLRRRRKTTTRKTPSRRIRMSGHTTTRRRRRRTGKKSKTRRQVGFLLSAASPLNKNERAKLARELRSGKVKIRNRS